MTIDFGSKGNILNKKLAIVCHRQPTGKQIIHILEYELCCNYHSNLGIIFWLRVHMCVCVCTWACSQMGVLSR